MAYIILKYVETNIIVNVIGSHACFMAVMVSMLTFVYVISQPITSFGIVGVLSDIFSFRYNVNNFRFFSI
jgi:hypothetical protein